MLEFDGLTKSFAGRPVLRGLSLAVRPGELYGFCGANGAGKTTAMRIALGVLAPDAGEVRWAGRRVDADVRRRIGYMPEERGLYGKMRPRDQLVYFARLSGIRPDVAARRADEWLERLGVRVGPKDPLERLSLGNQQRVQLIAALIAEPEVLILDEPFSGLDPVATDAMAGVLAEYRDRGVPVLFSSHQLDLVERLCDRVGIIRDGVIVAEGTVAELRRTAGRPEVRITLTGAPENWARMLPGVDVVAETGDTATLRTRPDTDLGELLDAARSLGELQHFGRREPSLAEIFREAMAA
ncbi:ABC transporter ATP-binding protein [Thermopolyspora flexuosa]|jgi:ABC-2 type transport system ATP-binding protein|uniref:ABC-2 type transport system ATP-binding protein n=1 Tax=Thermopolyspora flexuosa TaxID=103836 RepID=A0A543IUW2_9ACTN|nr:ATP-binding cassette domain-containing protein [Thermopolyspora flexuosa]PZN41711.1 MAG: ABC transporter ATP-binding protein [Actinomycetota bacterium]TQM74364.1 ABC-2 type transport system ATP-binding protein [Thermopolyspora flexuosa]GGM90473.1 ABC transporter ATP-binding protein [Thermopolyspora flexuosa]